MSKLVVNTKKKGGFKYEFPKLEATLSYHKLPVLEKQDILMSHMISGILPNDQVLEVAYVVMERMIDDWENVEDEHGESIKFDTKYIRGIGVDEVMQFVDDVVFSEMEEFKIAKDKLLKRSDKSKKKSETKNS